MNFKQVSYAVISVNKSITYAQLSEITGIGRGLSRSLQELRLEGRVSYELGPDDQVYDDMIISVVPAPAPLDKVWTQEDVKRQWLDAYWDLKGLQKAMSDGGSSLSASLSMALQLANKQYNTEIRTP